MFEQTDLISLLVNLLDELGQIMSQIGLSSGYKSDFEQCSNRLQLDLILMLVKFTYEFYQIMTRYDFLEVR